MRKLTLFYLLMIFLLGSSCEKDHLFNDPDQLLQENDNSANLRTGNLIYPKIKIAVVSDIHYTHPDLLPANIEDSPSLMQVLGLDRKILELSDPIFRKVISELIEEKPDILLIPGDLTKDGELMGHEMVKEMLQDLENTGIKVYVIPGNNDIFNEDAFSFVTEPPVSVPNINNDQFAEIYGNFGYNEALYRDDNSLSYICQPFNHVWILAIDNNEYTSTEEGMEVNGAINPATLSWIVEKMEEARENNIRVLTIMHWGILEHYAGQNSVESLISEPENNAIALMNAGIKLIFTGHYHANDIVEFTDNKNTLYDIQTGSLVTPPSPYRIMELDDHFINIHTNLVKSIDSELPEGMDFLEYCDVNLTSRLNSLYFYYLYLKYKLPEEYAAYFAPYVSRAYKAYFAGDEKMPPSERKELDAMPVNLGLLVDIVESIWTDLDPSDNKILIQLK